MWAKCRQKGAPSQLEEPESSHLSQELVAEQQPRLLEEEEDREEQEKQEKQEELAWRLVARLRRGWTGSQGNPKETT